MVRRMYCMGAHRTETLICAAEQIIKILAVHFFRVQGKIEIIWINTIKVGLQYHYIMVPPMPLASQVLQMVFSGLFTVKLPRRRPRCLLHPSIQPPRGYNRLPCPPLNLRTSPQGHNPLPYPPDRPAPPQSILLGPGPQMQGVIRG